MKLKHKLYQSIKPSCLNCQHWNTVKQRETTPPRFYCEKNICMDDDCKDFEELDSKNIDEKIKQDFIDTISELENEFKSFSIYLDNMRVHGCDLLNSDLVETAYHIFQIAIDNIADRFYLTRESLNWFVHENDFGNKKMEVMNRDDEFIPICNYSDFWDFEKG